VLTQEQLALRDAVRGLLDRTEPQWAPWSAGDGEPDYPGELWHRLCGEIGAAGLTIPERYGGAAAGPVERHVVLEEVGRALAPSPLLGSAVLAAEALLGSGDEAACARLLPAMVDGSLIAALAWVGAAGHIRGGLGASPRRQYWDPAEVACAGVPAADGWVLQGEAQYVLDGDIAGLLLVPAKMSEGIGLFEVSPGQPEVTRERATSMDGTRRLASVRLAGAAGRRIGGAAALATARDAACIALSAEQVGAAGRALELTVAYTKERVQFGRPIGGFQSLQHRMADLHVLVQSARSISYAAAEAAARGDDDKPLLAASAKAYCSEALQRVAAEMIQLHGAIGVTWEHKAQLFFKRAHGAAQLFGSPAEHVQRVASATMG
jgi:alkylation response protein AidB-like acyl-CoA dehydrogenase